MIAEEQIFSGDFLCASDDNKSCHRMTPEEAGDVSSISPFGFKFNGAEMLGVALDNYTKGDEVRYFSHECQPEFHMQPPPKILKQKTVIKFN